MENRYTIYTNIFFKKTNSQKVISNVSQAVECGLSRLTCISQWKDRCGCVAGRRNTYLPSVIGFRLANLLDMKEWCSGSLEHAASSFHSHVDVIYVSTHSKMITTPHFETGAVQPLFFHFWVNLIRNRTQRNACWKKKLNLWSLILLQIDVRLYRSTVSECRDENNAN